jgi:hypothetical protein
MNSMPKPELTDPRDVAVAALKQAFQEMARADQQLPRASDHVSKLEPDAARQPSDQQKWLAVARRMSSRGRLAVHGLIGLLLAACIGAAAIALWSHDVPAKQMMARRLPQLHLISSPAPESPVPAQPSPSAVQTSAAEAAPQQPTPPVVADSAPIAAAPAPGQEQLLQSRARERAAVERDVEQFKISVEQLKASQEQMARENAAVAEQFKAVQEQMVRQNAAVAEQLKASQEQMARNNAAVAERLKASEEQMVRDNAAAAEQLKASQEQVARLIANASEQKRRPKTAALPPRPIATPTGKPVPRLSSPQARAQPRGRSEQR